MSGFTASGWLAVAASVLVLLLGLTRRGRAAFGAYLLAGMAYAVATFALTLTATWAQIAIVSVLFLLAMFLGFGLLVGVNSEPFRTMSLQRSRELGFIVATINLLASCALILVGFAALHAFLFQHDLVTSSDGSSRDHLGIAVKYYLWQLADSVPALEIPDTLNVALKTTFVDHLSGILALLFRAIVVFAFLRGIWQLLYDALERKGLITPQQAGAVAGTDT